jgi:hypothetical protein
MYAPSFSDSDFDVDGYDVKSVVATAGSNVVTVTIEEGNDEDTDATPEVKFGTVQDANRNEVDDLDSVDAVSVVDAAEAADAADIDAVADAKANLTIAGTLTAVTADLTLATTQDGADVAWATSAAAAVTTTGVVARPIAGDGNTTVTLTATITKGDATDTKVFTATVLQKDFTVAGETTADATFTVTPDGYATTDFAAGNVTGTAIGTAINGTTFTVAYNAGVYTVSASGAATADAAEDATKTIIVTKDGKSVTLNLTIAAATATEVPTFTVQ